jgi:hypothetical protein
MPRNPLSRAIRRPRMMRMASSITRVPESFLVGVAMVAGGLAICGLEVKMRSRF